MSAFFGKQHKGAMKERREHKMRQAYLRQVDGIARGRTVRGVRHTFADPAEFLSAAARKAGGE